MKAISDLDQQRNAPHDPVRIARQCKSAKPGGDRA
jgi:hypothetical protein